MPNYWLLQQDDRGHRTAENLINLKKELAKSVPVRTRNETLLLATWNLREFESGKYGFRDDEPLFYIAEIIDHFDLVAVQEVRDDLRSLNRLIKILGGWWKYLLTDVTAGTQGNRERMAYLYDSRKMNFGGLTGEIVLPPKKKEATRQFARTPFITGFQAGWYRFTICTAHAIYGKAVADSPERIDEIKSLGKFLADMTKSTGAWAKNMILLGDFNIFSTKDKTFKALTSTGFVVPPQLANVGSNVGQTKHFDQIAFISPDEQDRLKSSQAGVFDFYKTVYTDGDESTYASLMGDPYNKAKSKKNYYREWRTFQMSDHLPMWIELKVDFSEDYLKKKSKGQKAKPPTSGMAHAV